MHTNWQGYDLLRRSRTMVLNDAPAGFRPIVQMIDNFSRNYRLGNIFETKVGQGSLLVCSIDVQTSLDQRPEARQLLRSLLAYIASPDFQPKQQLPVAFFDKLFAGSAISKMMEEPKKLQNAVLHVKAAAKLTELNKAEPWRKDADEILARSDGFDYTIRGWIWKDNVGSTWHSADDLLVTITCPKNFSGKLYAHLHDWNNLQRVAEIRFQGKELGTLDNYAGNGVWLAFPVAPQDSANGRLVLSVRPTHANAHVDTIVLTKGE